MVWGMNVVVVVAMLVVVVVVVMPVTMFYLYIAHNSPFPSFAGCASSYFVCKDTHFPLQLGCKVR